MAQVGNLICTGTSRFLNTIYSPVSMISNALVVGDQTSQTVVAMTPQSSTFQYGTNYLAIAHPVADIYRNAPWITTFQDTSLINTLDGASRIVLQKYSPSNGVYNILTSGVASNTKDEITFTNKAYNLTYNSTNGAFTIGSRKANTTSGSYSLSAGYNNTASGYSTSSLGNNCVSSGDYSVSCGYTCTASGSSTFAGGYTSTASGSDAFAFGGNCTSSGQYSVSFGNGCTATNTCSYAEGESCECSGSYSHAEGYYTKIASNTSFSHAEGYYSEVTQTYAHAEGYVGKAKGQASHAEGFRTEASGIAAHSEGYDTVASGDYSHAQGYYNTANHRSQHVFGEYCITDPSTASSTDRGSYIEIVGNGNHDTSRSNARTLNWSGNEWIAGTLTQGSSIEIKKNVADMTQEDGDKILNLRPVIFDYKSSEKDIQAERGFIAEEVKEIIPNLVTDKIVNDEGETVAPSSLNYIAMIPYLVKVCQRQQEEIDYLRNKLQNLCPVTNS